MEMAASAKDKIQASARELIKNLEDAVQAKRQNPENALKEGASSIEAALRAMFSSCTSPSNVVNTSESVEERKSSHNKELPRKKSEKSLTSSNKKDLAPVTQQKDIGDHIYAQLFFDDQIRAAKAVNSLRDQEGKALTKPFPASSPVTPPMKTQEVTPLDISANLTFDDSISAISAHTLEALARTSRSDLTDHDAHGSNPLPDPTERRDTLGAASSPFIASFPRTQSSQTNKSGFSKESKQSHSTRTTESSSFDAWQREENKFWNKEVKQVERSPRRSHRSRSDSVRVAVVHARCWLSRITHEFVHRSAARHSMHRFPKSPVRLGAALTDTLMIPSTLTLLPTMKKNLWPWLIRRKW